MRNDTIFKWTILVAALVLPSGPMLLAHAADQPDAADIPEMMNEQPATQSQAAANAAPGQATWIDEIRNSLEVYKKNYPQSNFDPYVKKLNLVGEALGRGDRRMVKVEMGGFFKMLAKRAYGLNESAADELSNFAVMVTPVQEYGIPVPRSESDQYGSDVSHSGSSSGSLQ
jgi:hypothetical protein